MDAQMQMFDPRETPTATVAMLAHHDLRSAIAATRRLNRQGCTWRISATVARSGRGPSMTRARGNKVFEIDYGKVGLRILTG
jgi:hypothetical protein